MRFATGDDGHHHPLTAGRRCTVISTRRMSVEVELVRWLMLVAAALGLVLVIASALAAGDPMPTAPGLLPIDMNTIAKPMKPAPVPPFYPENPPVREMPWAEAA